METFRRALGSRILVIAAPGAHGRVPPLDPANAAPFLGVWVIEMTEPPNSRHARSESGITAELSLRRSRRTLIPRPSKRRASRRSTTCWS